MTNRLQRHSLVIPTPLQAAIDKYSEANGLSFSEFARIAMANQLNRKTNDPPLARATRGRPRKAITRPVGS